MKKICILPLTLILTSCSSNGSIGIWGLILLSGVILFIFSGIFYTIARRKKQASTNRLSSFSQSVHNMLREFDNPKDKIAALKQLLERIEKDEKYRKTPDWKDRVSAKVYEHMAAVYYGMGENQNALKSFNKAIELDPSDGMNYYNRGSIYNNLEKYDEAITDFNDAIILMPDYASAYNNRGLAYEKLGRHEEALSDFNYAIEVQPSAILYYNRGNLFYELKRYQEAKDDYKKHLELDPDNKYDLKDYIQTAIELIDRKQDENN